MKTLLIPIFLIAAFAVTPATASVFVDVSANGPAGSEGASGEFPEQAWGRAATGPNFIPFAFVQGGLPPCCLDHVGGQAFGDAKVDGTRGQAGANALALHPGNGNSSRGEASGLIRDVLLFRGPQITINMDLLGSWFAQVTGDAEGSFELSMLVLLEADDPNNPDQGIEVYTGGFSVSRDLDGTRRWSIGSSVSGFLEGLGDPPPFHLSDSFLVDDRAEGLPVNLFMQVFANAFCAEGTGSCDINVQAFNTGYLGILGDYTSTHSYPGLPLNAVPGPQTLVLLGLGLAALACASFRGRSSARR